MPKWTEYTSKNTLADNDEVMLYDATARANKRGLMSKFWDYVVDKMATAVISKLETNNKTIIGAINALNGNIIPIISWKSPTNNITVPANSFSDVEIDVSMPGYEAMGVVGRQMNAPNCYTLKESISGGTNLSLTIMNATASDISINPAFLIIYYKNRN